MNDDHQVIPVVEDDQGEGWKDLIEPESLEARMERHRMALQRRQWRHAEKRKATPRAT